MRIIAIIILSLLCGVISAQQTYFSNFYDVTGSPNYTSSVIQKPDSGFIFINTDIGPVQKGYVFTSTDKSGDTIFTKRYYYSHLMVTTGASHSIIHTQDGNYVVSGSAIDTANVRNGWIMKFTPNGDTLWTKQYGGAASDFINSIYEDAQGDIWACGATTSWGNGQGDFWLIHFDQNGTVLWDTTYGTAQDESSVSGELTSDGGIIMGGRIGNSPYVVKVAPGGNVEWQYGYTAYNGYGYVSIAADSGYIVGCAKVISVTEAQACIVKLKPDGSELWNREVGFVNTEEVVYAKPVVTATSIVVGGVSTSSMGYYRGFISETDPFGYMLWQRAFTLDSTAPHYVYECLPTSDGGYLLGGSTFQSTQNAWLVKVDSMGCEFAGCDGVGYSEIENESTLSVFPNPANDFITFLFPGASQSRIVTISDALGRIIFNDVSGSNILSFPLSDYPPGMYFYQAQENGVVKQTGKFILER